jgi:hypothetical protein
MDISHMLPDDATSSKSSNYSTRSYESQRSMESNHSEAFLAMHLEAAVAAAADAAGHANAGIAGKGVPHSHWGNKAPMKKPVLESIISESNFSQLDDLDDPELDAQSKFSLKSKPQSVSAYAYSGKNSAKIALIEEGDEEEEGPDSRGSPVPGSKGAAAAAAAPGEQPSGNAYSAANLKKALKIAVSIAESTEAGEGTPKETSTATAKEPTTANAPASAAPADSSSGPPTSSPKPQLTVATSPLPPQYAIFPKESSPSHAHENVSFLHKTDSIDMEYGDARGYYRGVTDTGDNNSVGTWNTAQNTIIAQNQQMTSNTDAASVETMDRKHAHNIAHKINKQLHKVQKDVAELKEVARSIMQMYVYNGAENQLNLPGTLRARTEAAFESWTTAISGSSNVSAISLPDGLLGAAARDAVKQAGEGPTTGEARSDAAPNTGGSATTGSKSAAAGIPVLHRTDSFEADAGELPEIERRQISSVTKLSSLSSNSYATSYGEGSMIVAKLGSTKESPDLRGSAQFISTYHSEQPSPATTPGAMFPGGTSTSIRTSLIPAPIHIPKMTSSEPIPHLLSSSSSTPGVADRAGTTNIPFSSNTAPGAQDGAGGSVVSGGVRHGDGAHSIMLDPEYTSIDFIDMGFVELFREAKQEILKLLRDDKFPRWKATKEFQSFITSVRPYEKERNSGSNDSKEKGSDKDKSMNSLEK